MSPARGVGKAFSWEKVPGSRLTALAVLKVLQLGAAAWTLAVPPGLAWPPLFAQGGTAASRVPAGRAWPPARPRGRLRCAAAEVGQRRQELLLLESCRGKMVTEISLYLCAG